MPEREHTHTCVFQSLCVSCVAFRNLQFLSFCVQPLKPRASPAAVGVGIGIRVWRFGVGNGIKVGVGVVVGIRFGIRGRVGIGLKVELE